MSNTSDTDSKRLSDMELHDTIVLSDTIEVLKVHKGWIYKFYDALPPDFKTVLVSTCFVPKEIENHINGRITHW